MSKQNLHVTDVNGDSRNQYQTMSAYRNADGCIAHECIINHSLAVRRAFSEVIIC